MSQLPPIQGQGEVSPDGLWIWDGRRWVPNTAMTVAPAVYPAPAPYPGMVVAPKNPAVSLIVSLFIPGVGSMIDGDIGTGIAILVLYLVGVALAIFLIGIPILFGAWLWGDDRRLSRRTTLERAPWNPELGPLKPLRRPPPKRVRGSS